MGLFDGNNGGMFGTGFGTGFDYTNPNTLGWLGMMSALGQAAMPSRLPVPTGAVLASMAGGAAAGSKAFENQKNAAEADLARQQGQLAHANVGAVGALVKGMGDLVNPTTQLDQSLTPATPTTPTLGQPQADNATASPLTPQGNATVANAVPAGPDKADNWETKNNNFAGLRIPGVNAGPNSGGFQSFSTPEAGVNAISHQLDRYASGATTGTPLGTVRQIVGTWAPPSENDTAGLVARASKIVGVDPDAPLNVGDPGTKAKLIEAMIRGEQGGKLPVDPQIIQRVAGVGGNAQVAQGPQATMNDAAPVAASPATAPAAPVAQGPQSAAPSPTALLAAEIQRRQAQGTPTLAAPSGQASGQPAPVAAPTPGAPAVGQPTDLRTALAAALTKAQPTAPAPAQALAATSSAPVNATQAALANPASAMPPPGPGNTVTPAMIQKARAYTALASITGHAAPKWVEDMVELSPGMPLSPSYKAAVAAAEANAGVPAANAKEQFKADQDIRSKYAGMGMQLGQNGSIAPVPGFSQTQADVAAAQAAAKDQAVVHDLRQGGVETKFSPATGQMEVVAQAPRLPEGTSLATDASGQPIAREVPGALPAIQHAQAAVEAGKAQIQPLQEQNQVLQKEYETHVVEPFNHAQDALEPLTAIQNAMQNYATGPGAQTKLQVEKAIQAAATTLGFDPTSAFGKEIAAGEVISKEGTNLGFTLARSLGSRESQMIVQQAIASNPGLANSPAGNVQLISLIKQGLQRDIDKRSFVDNWFNQNHTFSGATEAFNKAAPVETYISKAVPYQPKNAEDYKGLTPGVTYLHPQTGTLKIKPLNAPAGQPTQ